jgi:hypothetical protein
MDSRCDLSYQRILQRFDFGGVFDLEQVLPGLVGRHVETQTDSLEGGRWRLDVFVRVFDLDFFHDFLVKSGREFGVEGSQFGHALVVGGRRVLAEPHFHQGHKDSITRNVRLVEVIGLPLPLFSQFGGHFLNKGGELVELLLCIAVGEQVEIRVVEDLAFFGPAVVG